jgi:hypothetical protein
MTPAEKAQDLFNKMFSIPDGGFGSVGVYEAKQCALIAVDEIIKAHIHNEGVRHLKWWQEVKQEIIKL